MTEFYKQIAEDIGLNKEALRALVLPSWWTDTYESEDPQAASFEAASYLWSYLIRN